ncbi:MAG: alanine--tRNA ligase [Candidatus Moraniibacteriota bacterium]
MQTSEIRAKYLEFFEKKGHAIVPSSLLVPENDPSTLFTGSGMQPMVPYLLGEKHPAGTRVTNSQKCFRSQDIEEVGDNRHTTFFEMLGNWSFGDYFKAEQVEWMWEFLTMELKLDPKRLYFSCFRGNETINVPRDTTSAERWQSLFQRVGIDAKIGEDSEKNGMQPDERVFYYSEKKNWWSRAGMPDNMPIGEPGGGDTEMFWDFGVEPGLHEKSIWKKEPCHVNCDCGRFMEIGNNVFMEYKKTEVGFEKLAKRNVDFGGGLERMAAAVADDPDVFKLDLFTEAKTTLETLSTKLYGESAETTHAFRVILDHIRAAVFLIGDGVLPSNKDQGYFVRRLIRRAVRFGNMLGMHELFIQRVAECFIDTYNRNYTNFSEKRVMILNSLSDEEVKFRKTLEQGLHRFDSFISNPEGNYLVKRVGDTVERADLYPNDDTANMIFDLYQTYGFPLELVFEELKRRGIKIDEEKLRKKFDVRFEKHQDLSRTASAGKFKGGLADHSAKVTALHTATHLMLAGLRRELGNDVHQAGSNITEERTRFDFTYPEKVPREVLDRVEAYVNEAIGSGATVGTTIMEKGAAKAAGVEGSFWEKYPEKVTVYQVQGQDGTLYSQELCGGPHVGTTADIAAFGHFRIIKEEASSAGVRRVKAILT